MSSFQMNDRLRPLAVIVGPSCRGQRCLGRTPFEQTYVSVELAGSRTFCSNFCCACGNRHIRGVIFAPCFATDNVVGGHGMNWLVDDVPENVDRLKALLRNAKSEIETLKSEIETLGVLLRVHTRLPRSWQRSGLERTYGNQLVLSRKY